MNRARQLSTKPQYKNIRVNADTMVLTTRPTSQQDPNAKQHFIEFFLSNHDDASYALLVYRLFGKMYKIKKGLLHFHINDKWQAIGESVFKVSITQQVFPILKDFAADSEDNEHKARWDATIYRIFDNAQLSKILDEFMKLVQA